MEEWGLSPESEVRTRVRASNFRLPDVSLVPIPREFTGVQSEPPSIAIEIRSEDDKAVDLEKRARDLRAMGVPRVWMVDPQERRVFAPRHGVGGGAGRPARREGFREGHGMSVALYTTPPRAAGFVSTEDYLCTYCHPDREHIDYKLRKNRSPQSCRVVQAKISRRFGSHRQIGM